MPHEVVMPQMGESIAEGTITTWLKKVGDRVERDEPLFEISTDKVDAEIPSPASGILTEIKVQPGQTVAINTVVALLTETGESAPTATAAKDRDKAGAKREESLPPTGSAPANGRTVESGAAVQPAETPEEARHIRSSPLVRKIAAESGVDISQIAGTGLGGRITKQDILAHVESAKRVPSETPAKVSVVPSPATAPQAAATSATIPETYQPRIYPGDRVEDMSVMRTRIAEHMVLSRHLSAHVQTVWEVDFEKIGQLRAKHKAAWQEKHGVNLTFTAFILKVAVDALKAVPVVNASMDQAARKVIFHQHVSLGIAVALDWGLIVPVIHGADELNTLGLARRAADLAERARTKKLKPEEVQGGTFTVTNPGQFGQLFGLPVINQPQVAILGVGAIEKRPVVIDDMIAVRNRCYLSLSFDHRLVDGAVAEKFMAQVKKGLEGFDEADLQ
jgi:pyruvate dehydrogenase E2 component (dihydrolipoamide acetyltransferase)